MARDVTPLVTFQTKHCQPQKRLRNPLPMCRNKFGHVGRNRLRSNCVVASHSVLMTTCGVPTPVLMLIVLPVRDEYADIKRTANESTVPRGSRKKL